MQREKEEAAALRRRNAAAVKQVLAPPPPPVAHSSKPLTEPVGVELFTSKRPRLHGMATRSTASWAWDECCHGGSGCSHASAGEGGDIGLQGREATCPWANLTGVRLRPSLAPPHLQTHKAGQPLQVDSRADCGV